MSNLRHPGTGRELLLQVLQKNGPGIKHHMKLQPQKNNTLRTTSQKPKQ